MVNFTKNWNNKLNCDIFTTIRKHTKEKERFYNKQIGQYQNVNLSKKIYCKAKLILVMITTPSKIEEPLLMLDTGSEKPMEILNKFGIDETDWVILLVYKKIKSSTQAPRKSQPKDKTNCGSLHLGE